MRSIPTPPPFVPIPAAPIDCVRPGIYLQIYRGKITGSPQKKLDTYKRYCDDIRVLGLPGVVWHGFPHELTHNWDQIARIATERGLLALAAWGLDGSIDEDNTRLTAREKGLLVGEVVARPNCKAGLSDAEGQWDSTVDANDDMNESGALEFGSAMREKAPLAIIGSQPWFALDSHGELRRTPRPLGAGGPFAGFPVDEFRAMASNWFDFPQAYANNFTSQWGERRYEKTFAWMERDWTHIEPALEAAGIARKRSITIQGYGWSPRSLSHCLLDWWTKRQLPVIVWSEPWPEPLTLRVIRGVSLLIARDFAIPGIDPRDAARAYQIDYNRTAPVGKKLDEDGWMGEKTLRSLGV